MLQIFLLKITFYSEGSHEFLQRLCLQRLCLSGKRRFLGKVSNLVRNYRKSVILDILLVSASAYHHVNSTFLYTLTLICCSISNFVFCIFSVYIMHFCRICFMVSFGVFCTHTVHRVLNHFNCNIFYNTPYCFKILSLFVS